MQVVWFNIDNGSVMSAGVVEKHKYAVAGAIAVQKYKGSGKACGCGSKYV